MLWSLMRLTRAANANHEARREAKMKVTQKRIKLAADKLKAQEHKQDAPSNKQ